MEREYLVAGLSDDQVKDYYYSMIDSAVVIGANKTQAEQELIDALEFEMRLAEVSVFLFKHFKKEFILMFVSWIHQISLPREELRNSTALYNSYTIKELQISYPYLDWLDYINAFLPANLNVDENEIVINTVPTFFEQLADILNSTSKRTMANYLLGRAVLKIANMLTNELREKQFRFSMWDFIDNFKSTEKISIM